MAACYPDCIYVSNYLSILVCNMAVTKKKVFCANSVPTRKNLSLFIDKLLRFVTVYAIFVTVAKDNICLLSTFVQIVTIPINQYIISTKKYKILSFLSQL